MVRSAGELRLDELSLSTRAKKYLKRHYGVMPGSIETIVFEGRLMAYDCEIAPYRVDSRRKSMIEFAEALDKAGFIRHDLNEKSFHICRLYRAITRDESIVKAIPTRLEDLKYIISEDEYGDTVRRQNFRVGNERYETFLNPVDRLEQIKFALKENLKRSEAAVIIFKWGLEDGESHTLQEVGNRFGLTRERIRQIEVRGLRRLRDEGLVKLPKIMLNLRWSDDEVSAIIEEIDLIRQDPVFQEEAKLRQKLIDIARSPFRDAENAADFLNNARF